jgi:hypothetical protein
MIDSYFESKYTIIDKSSAFFIYAGITAIAYNYSVFTMKQ